MQLLLEKKVLGLLLDQKMNDGIPVPFFGRDAMTAPALAQFALKYGCPVVPAHVIRLGGARFRLVIEPPMTIAHTGDRHADILTVMTQVNQTIEGWIREHPGPVALGPSPLAGLTRFASSPRKRAALSGVQGCAEGVSRASLLDAGSAFACAHLSGMTARDLHFTCVHTSSWGR